MPPGLPYSGVSEGKDPVVLDDHQKGAHNGQVWFNSHASLSYHGAQYRDSNHVWCRNVQRTTQ